MVLMGYISNSFWVVVEECGGAVMLLYIYGYTYIYTHVYNPWHGGWCCFGGL